MNRVPANAKLGPRVNWLRAFVVMVMNLVIQAMERNNDASERLMAGRGDLLRRSINLRSVG
jgi:hypothetical protein